MKTQSPYDIKRGNDGKWYIVFANSYEREQFDKHNPGKFDSWRHACFGQFDNAYEVPK